MRYSPSSSDRRAKLVVWALIAAGAAVFCLQGAFPRARAVLQAGAVVLFGTGIWFAVRFLMTTIVCEIALRTPDDLPGGVPAMHADVTLLPPEMLDLVVSRGVGQRAPVVTARMGLDELVWFGSVTRRDLKSAAPYRKYPSARTYDYTVSLHPDTLYLAVFLDSANNASALLLELSPEMAERLQKIGKGEG